MMRFLAVDVETANADFSSICQIGLAEFENGEIINTWSTLIDPEDYFDPFNISIHGITESDVINAPTFDKIYDEIRKRLSGEITIHHMPFDRVAISRVCEKYNKEALETTWLDSAKIVKRTWEEFSKRGFGLSNISQFLKIDFNHHNALDDAIAAGKVVNEACKIKGLTITDWLDRVSRPINPFYANRKLEGNPEGEFFGEILVFTGSMSLTRGEAATIAFELGCTVTDSVTKKTTLLVVGTQDATKLAGYEKSSKHRKAEELNNKGIPIKIISEKDFIELLKNETTISVSKPKIKRETNTSNKEKKNTSLTVKIELDNEHLVSINKQVTDFWDNLTEDEKQKIKKGRDENRNFINSIEDKSHDEKRKLAKEFGQYYDKFKEYYSMYKIDSYEDDDIDVLFNIEMEIDTLRDNLNDLRSNKIELKELYETTIEIIESIQTDIDENVIPDQVKKYGESIIDELNKIKQKIRGGN